MAPSRQSLTVLVVEDEALLRWSLAELLRSGGHSVIEASSADGARGVIARAPAAVDVVLLDYRLPDSRDLQLLDEIRQLLPQSAVILMTAYSQPELVQGALEAGAYCVLSKPFDLHGVERLITEAHLSSRTH
jgi:DNA-binding NtrC family response regulator